jgi:superfamily II DNA or RNA helicase
MSTVDSVLSGSKLEHRPYQKNIISKGFDCFAGQYTNGAGVLQPANRSVLIESPTGSGKTPMGLSLARCMQVHHKDVDVYWVAMRRELLAQSISQNNQHGIGLDFKTLSMFENDVPERQSGRKVMLVIDEAQHDSTSTMAKIHEKLQPDWILGLSATPFRTDRVKLCFERTIKDAGIHQLIQQKYLSQYDHYTIPSWDVNSLADLYAADPVRWGKSVFFFLNNADVFAMKQALADRGVDAEAITGFSDRETQLARFSSGEVKVVVNCMVLTEGFDCPDLQTVFCRPSRRGPTIQMAGRVFRKHPDIVVKQVVQCTRTKHAMPRTATPRIQFVWNSGEWRSLKSNPKADLMAGNAMRAIADSAFETNEYFTKRAGKSEKLNFGRRARGRSR